MRIHIDLKANIKKDPMNDQKRQTFTGLSRILVKVNQVSFS